MLTSKPASELRPSAQKRVQGTLEFSLETPRAIAKAAADATTAATTRDGSMSPMNDLTHSATQGSLVPSGMATIANGAASAKGEPPQPFDAGAAAKLQAPHLDNATYELEERAGGGIDDHNAKEQDDEWDRMRWAADNHGGDAGSVGTVEVASKTTDKNGETGPAKAEPEDLLIRLKEVTGLVEVNSNAQVSFICFLALLLPNLCRTGPAKDARYRTERNILCGGDFIKTCCHRSKPEVASI